MSSAARRRKAILNFDLTRRKAMEAKVFSSLPSEAAKIRRAVFIEEQGFKEEFDETDSRARHLVLYDGEKPVGACRFFAGDTVGDYIIGRLAVIKDYRGRGAGARLLGEAESAVRREGGKRVLLHAQISAKGFYEKQGYSAFGEADSDEGCPHIWMCRRL